jgi:Yip1 domain
MAAVPTPPVTSSPTPSPEATPALSEGARIINTFIAPSKTFTDLRRSAAWWAPFLLMTIVSTIFVYTAGQKIGFRKIMENQMQAQPKAQARMEQLPPDQRERQMEGGAKFMAIISYGFPVITLIIWLIIASALFATFKVAAGADVSFGVSLAIVVYSALPLMLKTLLATLSVVAGINPDSFSFQNPVATNPGYFMNPADGVFLYSVASAVDIFMIWTLALTAIGFTCVSKVKRGTAFAVVFGWWTLFTLGGAALGAAFS